jgi:hypothetical protein
VSERQWPFFPKKEYADHAAALIKEDIKMIISMVYLKKTLGKR